MNDSAEQAAGTEAQGSVDHVLGLLTEYSVRLKEHCDRFDSIQDQSRIRVLVYLIPLILLTVPIMLYFSFFLRGWDMVHEQRLAITASGLAVFASTLMGYMALLRSTFREKRRAFRDIDQLFGALSKIVSRASEIHSNRKLNELEQFSLDIKLAEAETVLRHANSITNMRLKPLRLSDILFERRFKQ